MSYTGDGGKSFSRYERDMYPEWCAALEDERDENEDDDDEQL